MEYGVSKLWFCLSWGALPDQRSGLSCNRSQSLCQVVRGKIEAYIDTGMVRLG
jgi:hypothetical protein